jgi:hypothetical protein
LTGVALDDGDDGAGSRISSVDLILHPRGFTISAMKCTCLGDIITKNFLGLTIDRRASIAMSYSSSPTNTIPEGTR